MAGAYSVLSRLSAVISAGKGPANVLLLNHLDKHRVNASESAGSSQAVPIATVETHASEGCGGAVAERAGSQRFGPRKEGREVYKEVSRVSVEIAEGRLPLKRFPPSALLHSSRYIGQTTPAGHGRQGVQSIELRQCGDAGRDGSGERVIHHISVHAPARHKCRRNTNMKTAGHPLAKQRRWGMDARAYRTSSCFSPEMPAGTVPVNALSSKRLF